LEAFRLAAKMLGGVSLGSLSRLAICRAARNHELLARDVEDHEAARTDSKLSPPTG